MTKYLLLLSSVVFVGGAAFAMERPTICTMEYNPVCAENGTTYGNACMAAADGQTISYQWECIQDLLDDDFDSIVAWAHQNGLTDYSNSNDFGRERPITREQAAKMYVQFASTLGLLTHNTSLTCSFSDSLSIGTTLRTFAVQSCRAWLFRWDNGAFWPHQNLTKAQALALIMRLVDGSQDESSNPWWWNYADRAAMLGVLDIYNYNEFDLAISRWGLITWMHQVATRR